MTGIQRFFLICAGSDLSVIKRTPTDLNKHIGIGATIFFTGLFAAFAGGYACYTVFNSYVAAILMGCFWGMMIFNLDRYIVSSMKMSKSGWRNFGSAMPRIILAIIIAIVIAKPLELRIFDSEIQSEIALMQQENIKAQEDLVASRFERDITQATADIQSLKDEITAKELVRDELDALAIQEADGTGGSQQRNIGPIYRAKKADASKAQSELDALLAVNNPLIMLLFIAIETTPIFVKLISRRSPYDFVLDKHEHVFATNHQLMTSKLQSVTDNKVMFNKKMGAFKTELAINTEKKIIKEAVEESYDAIKSRTKKLGNIFSRNSVVDF